MSNKIKCPNCGEQIDVNDVFAHQTEEKYKQLLADERKKIITEAERVATELEKRKNEFDEKVKRQNEIFAERLEKEKAVLSKSLEEKVKLDFEQHLKAKDEELAEKSKKLNELRQKEIEVERLKRSMSEQEQNMELEFQKRLLKERSEYEEVLIKREQERAKIKSQEQDLKMREKDKALEDMKRQLEEVQRRAEQGSMQLQGEVQELAIEEYLRENFPFDTVEEIKKGQRGADCLQVVNNGFQQNCGTIYYESKRTKHFTEGWIDKFKADMRAKGADIGVLVTQAMPADMEIMGERNGIWVCTFEEFKGLAFVLRQTIIRIAQERSSQENKGDKMHMLYDFLTSNEFRMQVEGIVEGFRTMKDDLDRERRAMEKLWKQREKQLEKVILNTTNMYGSVRGIAGKAVQTVEYLELPDAE